MENQVLETTKLYLMSARVLAARNMIYGSTNSTYAFISMISRTATGMLTVMRMNALRMGFTRARTITSSPNRTKN